MNCLGRGALFLFILPFISCGISEKRLDSVFKEYTDTNQFSGSIVIVKNGNVIFDESNFNNTANGGYQTIFPLTSISKHICAIITFMAIDENKLALDDTIGTFIPGIQKGEKITISNLLTHTSGFSDALKDYEHREEMNDLDDVVLYLTRKPSLFEPGERYAYCDSNFQVLAAILEIVYGKKYEDIIDEKIARKYSLDTIGCGESIFSKRNVVSDGKFGGIIKRAFEKRVYVPVATSYADALDLAILEKNVISGNAFSKEMLDQISVGKFKDEYGFSVGLGCFSTGSDKIYFHEGSGDVFLNMVFVDRKEKIIIVVLSNYMGVTRRGQITRYSIVDDMYQAMKLNKIFDR